MGFGTLDQGIVVASSFTICSIRIPCSYEYSCSSSNILDMILLIQLVEVRGPHWEPLIAEAPGSLLFA